MATTKGEIARTKQAGLVLLGYIDQLLRDNPRLLKEAQRAIEGYKNPLVNNDIDYTLIHVGRLGNVFGITSDYR
jgi:hypothetical protein